MPWLEIGLMGLFILAAIGALLYALDSASGIPNSNKRKGKTKL
jgi:hypothetical protein